MKSFNRVAAQGEITIIRLGDAPADGALAGIPLKAEAGRYVIGYSETGHHHVIDADGACVVALERAPAGMRVLRAILRHPTALTHLRPYDAHEPIRLEPGLYEFRAGREYDPYEEIARRQAD